jgi:hypothetical protein
VATYKSLSRRFFPDANFVHRRIADETLLVPLRQPVAEQYIYVLNPVANRIWELLDGQRTLAQVRDLLLEEFEVSPLELEQDIIDFIERLQELGSVRET